VIEAAVETTARDYILGLLRRGCRAYMTMTEGRETIWHILETEDIIPPDLAEVLRTNQSIHIYGGRLIPLRDGLFPQIFRTAQTWAWVEGNA